MTKQLERFADRILPAPLDGGFNVSDHWVWCGSVVRADAPGDDGRYHMLATCYEKTTAMAPYWLFTSRIVRASSDTPEGHYHYEEEVLSRRQRSFFDGMVQHNPSIKYYDGVYYLYYFGATYEAGDLVFDYRNPYNSEIPEHVACFQKIWSRKRIGLATATSINGPWTRRDTPLLETRDDAWDRLLTTNPSVAIREDGYSVMIYKSRTSFDQPMQLGIATAPHPAGPYTPTSDQPEFAFHCEDPFIWHEDGRYHVIMKDMSGEICGEEHAGIYAQSEDGIHWDVGEGDAAKAYSRKVLWEDGVVREQGSFERPNLLIQDGKPTHLFAATCKGPERYWASDHTWNMCIPLKG